MRKPLVYSNITMRVYLLLLTGLLAAATVDAAEWTIDSEITQDLFYNDNVRLTKDAEGSFVYQLTPVLNGRYQTDHANLLASASYGTQQYTNIPILDRSNQNYDLKAGYHTERTTYNLSTNYNVAPARNTALNDTGNFATIADKKTRLLASDISYRLNQKDSLKFFANYFDPTYTSKQFADINTLTLTPTWERKWSERHTGSVGLFYSRFEGERTTLQSKSDSYGVNFSSRWLLTEHWEFSGGVGFRLTDTTNTDFLLLDNATTQIQNKGFLADTGIKYQRENLSATLAFNRSLIPSGFGLLNEQTRLDLNLNYQLSERLTASFTAGYQTSQSISTQISPTRENITLQPSINWQMTQSLMLRGSYRYFRQDISSRDYVADANTFMLTFAYNWQGLSFAR